MSAPETKALSPAPASTTTRIARIGAEILEHPRNRFPHVQRDGVAPLGIVEDEPADRAVLARDDPDRFARRQITLRSRSRVMSLSRRSRSRAGFRRCAGRSRASAAAMLGRRARELDRLVQDLEAAELGMLDLGRGLQVLDLRVGEHLVHRCRSDRTARRPCSASRSIRRVFFAERLVDLRVQLRRDSSRALSLRLEVGRPRAGPRGRSPRTGASTCRRPRRRR